MNKAGKFLTIIAAGGAVTGYVMCNRSPEDGKTGKAGDHLDLYAVLNIAERSSSPESFERSLNEKSSGINNLDLNEDGETDYIRVVDKTTNDAHVLILQDLVSADATQDVAVIEIKKTGEKSAAIQIIGDEDLYGKDFIVEPKSKTKSSSVLIVATTGVVNVWSWPLVTYVYSPSYVVWTSPYYYEYYPVWWEPWPVVAYEVYSPTVVVYHSYYQPSDGYRFVDVHETYKINYHTNTHFVYHEKNYGGKNGDYKDNRSPGKDGKNTDPGDRTGNPGNGNKPGNDKGIKPQPDNKGNAKPAKDNYQDKGNGTKSPAQDHKDGKGSKDNYGGNGGKKDAGQNAPAPKNTNKKDVKQPNQNKGSQPGQGSPHGGKGGGHK